MRRALNELDLRVDCVEERAPDIKISLVARQQEGISKADQPDVARVPMRDLTRLRYFDRESPAIHAGIPLAGRPADLAVYADLAGEDAAVGLGSFRPGVHILQQPTLVLRLVRLHVGVQSERRGG